MTDTHTIHVHKRNRNNFSVLLLLVPSIVFVLVLTALIKVNQKLRSVISEPLVQNEVVEELVPFTIGRTQMSVWISDTPQKLSQGLSGKSSLPDDVGMLFIFPKQDIRPTFWMKDMYFDIEIIWINDGKISQITSASAPESSTPDQYLKLYVPADPIDMVLEVNTGFSQKYNIKPGDRIKVPSLSQTQSDL